MTSVIFPYYITRHLEIEIERAKKHMLQEIANEYNLDETKLLQKYLLAPAKKKQLRIAATDPQKAYNSDASPDVLCEQITKKDKRCRRSKCSNSIYCSIHLQWNKNGTQKNDT